MCGLIGYIGKKNAKEIILKGLKRLEYRGYDSSGLAIFDSNKKLHISKRKGNVSKLVDKIANNGIDGNIAIGHTRWATHGVPNNINAHPHIDYSKKFILACNVTDSLT